MQSHLPLYLTANKLYNVYKSLIIGTIAPNSVRLNNSGMNYALKMIMIMKVAISIWNERVSPGIDKACHLFMGLYKTMVLLGCRRRSQHHTGCVGYGQSKLFKEE